MRPTEFGHFKGPRAKLARAKHHAHVFDEELRKFLALDPYEVVVEFDAVKQELNCTAKQTVETPCLIPIVFGDLVHNLRSALDQLASELVVLQNKSTAGVYFPTGVDQAGFEEALAKNVKKAGQHAIDKLRALEVYRGGAGGSIRVVHDLDIADKHSMLIPTASKCTLLDGCHVVGTNRFFIGEMPILIGKEHGGMGQSVGGIKISGHWLSSPIKFEFRKAARFEIAIREVLGASETSMDVLAKELVAAVEGAIDAFVDDPAFAFQGD